MILRCATCQIPLSEDVELLMDRSRISIEDKSDYILQGYYMLASAADQTDSHTDGEFILNLKDIKNIQRHPNTDRLAGCCGLDGLSGINTVCTNGHEIGYMRTDCWLPHYIHIPPANVETVEAEIV
jgi:hypothetical protein